ncbi:MAG: methyltransferase domain-containing protein [Roseovarius sp.]
MDSFGIKPGYRCNFETVQPMYSDEASLEYQQSVYEYAQKFAQKSGVRSVLDVGCGLGLKLAVYFDPLNIDITGVDVEETIRQCKERHQFGRWISDDLENPYANLGGPHDMIICADVIEHLNDPDHLLAYLRKWAAPGTSIILSTPERDLRRGVEDMGPPQNTSHVREWNRKEFGAYLTSRGVKIFDHLIVALRDDKMSCQLVHCIV